MRIERVRIEAYRSLYDVTVQPGQFTVVVGPNNSGKSNLVEAFDFLADIHRHGVDVAVSRKGGFENIAHRRVRRTRRPIQFEVTATLFKSEFGRRRRVRVPAANLDQTEMTEPMYRVLHAFAIAASGQAIEADFSVTDERFVITPLGDPDNEPLLSITRNQTGIVFDGYSVDERRRDPEVEWDELWPLPSTDFQRFVNEQFTSTVGSTSLMLPSLFSDVINLYSQSLSRARLYQLAPLECRRPGVSTPNAEIDLHGGNLPALIAYMQRHHKRPWQQVLQAMRRIVPDLETVRTGYTHDRRLTLEFVESDVGRPWTSDDVSDGTIQSLALFAALFDPRSPLAVIEEPENSVHPWILRVFADACRAASYKQTILTTHSPALLDYLRPEEILLAWRKDGRTHLAPLTQVEPDAARLWSEGTTTIFELLDSGTVEVAVPGGFR
ncbi:MAG: AAA family ATPase [Actinobacteria bacterium]|nr:AAA family ATPase [Actinomycetota bacterium]